MSRNSILRPLRHCLFSVSVCVCCFLLFASYSLHAQLISQAEYFFDVDPGPGNGTPIIISVPADPITFTATVSTTGLPGGIHYLFLRTRTANGFWSLYEPQEFYILDAIVASEYFFDVDPGPGNGTALAVPLPADPVNFNATINTTGLTGGHHVLYVRTRNAKGWWSLYEPREFYILDAIVASEYFFDVDPGPGNGTALAVPLPADPVNYNATISTTGLTGGPHYLFIRTRNANGWWSLYEPREFYILDAIVAAESFFDVDPGPGNGTPIIVPLPADPVNFNSTLNTVALPAGEHVAFVRTKNAKGIWSLYEGQSFYVKHSIVAAEYFIDLDPGVGSGTPIVITPSVDTITFASAVTTPLLPFGTHYLFVRTKDAYGNWSLYEPQQFDVGSPLPVTLISFDAVPLEKNRVLARWQTASEYNNDFFTVEKSANATDFFPFAYVDGAGNSQKTLGYDAIDAAPFENISYYRLKQTDFNGRHTFSKVVAVRFINQDIYFILYPNPNAGSFDIAFDWKKASTAEVQIMNSMGQLVYASTFDVQGGQNRWNADVQSLKKGLYLLRLKIGDVFGCHRFEIE